MGKANKPTGLYFNLAQDLKDDNPSWPDIQQEAKELARLVAALRQGDASQGRQGFLGPAHQNLRRQRQGVEAAASKMDPEAARAAHAKMGEPACMTCHKAHRPE